MDGGGWVQKDQQDEDPVRDRPFDRDEEILAAGDFISLPSSAWEFIVAEVGDLGYSHFLPQCRDQRSRLQYQASLGCIVLPSSCFDFILSTLLYSNKISKSSAGTSTINPINDKTTVRKKHPARISKTPA